MDETVSTEPLPETAIEKRLYWSAKRASWFGCILYPDEDRKHRVFMDYLDKAKAQYPKYVYIVHDRDVYTSADVESDPSHSVGEKKKPHVHLIFNRARACPPSTVKNYFGVWVNYFEPISDSVSYISYMLHTNPESLELGKPLYRPDELIGDQRTILQAIRQNAKCVSLNEIFDYISRGDIGSVKETIDTIRKEKPDLFLMYLDTWKDYGYIINQYCRDAKEEKWNEFLSTYVFADTFDAETKEKLSKLFWRGSRFR